MRLAVHTGSNTVSHWQTKPIAPNKVSMCTSGFLNKGPSEPLEFLPKAQKTLLIMIIIGWLSPWLRGIGWFRGAPGTTIYGQSHWLAIQSTKALRPEGRIRAGMVLVDGALRSSYFMAN